MENYKNFEFWTGDIRGDRKKVDNTIYTFDIETTSYIIFRGEILQATEYLKLNEKEREECEFRSNMYIWMFSINDKVYFGRTWEEFEMFLYKLEYYNKNKKIVFVHNLSFEFQYLKSIFLFQQVIARKKHKVMKAIMQDYNIEFRCSYMMSNCALKYLPKIFNLSVEKKVR